MKLLFKIVVFALVLFGIYYTFIYYIPFSEGYRAGELTKISNKGVMFKTWEGEISQGVSESQRFTFSVESGNVDVIDKLKELQGEPVKLTYKERYDTFPWLGDTKYFITGVSVTDHSIKTKNH